VRFEGLGISCIANSCAGNCADRCEWVQWPCFAFLIYLRRERDQDGLFDARGLTMDIQGCKSFLGISEDVVLATAIADIVLL
jgi:hypothetical protein